MNKREAKRLACRTTGRWLIQTDTTGLPDDTPDHVVRAVMEAQRELAHELLRRGGTNE